MQDELLDQPLPKKGTPYYEQSRRYNRYIGFTLFFSIAVVIMGQSSGEEPIWPAILPLLMAFLLMLLFCLLSIYSLCQSYWTNEQVTHKRTVLLITHSLTALILMAMLGQNILRFYHFN